METFGVNPADDEQNQTNQNHQSESESRYFKNLKMSDCLNVAEDIEITDK
jgi:hypothetical protein